jgi:mitochondrial fission protein ELM1
MPAIKRADVWVLLGPHRGDNNQVLALAEGLGRPFRTIQMEYRWFAHLPAVARRVSIAQLAPEARRKIAAPWPSLVIGIGQRSVPVARYIKHASGGRSTIVRLGDPMVSPRYFDLVLTTAQYAVGEADNVVRLPLNLTNSSGIDADPIEERWLERLAQPRRLVVIGGKTSMWRFDPETLSAAIATLRTRARLEGGSVLAVSSPRTSSDLIAAARVELGHEATITGSFPRYAALLSSADEIHVTGDSVAMLSDAVSSGKPVGLIPLEPDPLANFLRQVEAVRGRPFRMRDLTKFWDDLRSRGLVGTVDEPRHGTLDVDPLDIALKAVRAAMNEPLPGRIVPVRLPAARPAARPAIG